ncbi:hypothetical protein [Reichenbachiella ulvae]|uniref:Uncharacterized protein n=1 Tax=Reichenbachiella ulvae TaxID=2980104 RepID=A0ABT3D104_9BACT|nr:hypothetical protein [Reichenbachiella ulvae]MCV9389464.1 hypothetical protein [Reichenbachiella ulvae]
MHPPSFAVMEWIAKMLLLPFTWITLIMARWRRIMFKTGRWKSVEFELPTIAVLHHFRTQQLLTYLPFLNNLMDGGSISFIPRLSLLNAGETLDPIDGANYSTLRKGDSKVIGYRQSMVLAVSECFALYSDMKSILVPTRKLNFEIRQQSNLLLTSSERLFWNETMSPVGNRLEPLNQLHCIDVCLIFYKELADLIAIDQEARSFCGKETLVCFVRESSAINQETMEVYYSPDGSEFATDRDTFVRLFINSLFGTK